ncbi:hypothetical protein SPI_03923 [Niveomyces insectorum RCEF 264]|uniref:Xylanolytic transcriptional activator regulatory domain-containing protein n=1 Tax=Niveomyces insectorum RCEF 264 TaxID=1081102 RepID=A0A162MLH1_9HYPO|nr:hypothetical protein SPI_03923 [Niveomyces insectorum RCEF 264]
MYDDLSTQRIDTSGGTREILGRLREIEHILEGQTERLAALSSGAGNTHSGQTGTSLESHQSMPLAHHFGSPLATFPLVEVDVHEEMAGVPPLTIPVKHKTSSSYLLSLPAMKALIGEYPTDLFFLLESRTSLPHALSFENGLAAGPLPTIDHEVTDYLVSAFFSTAHECHPVLDEGTFRALYTRVLETGIDKSIESALCLVVLAVGAVAMSSSAGDDFCNSPPGMEYMQHALPTLITLSSWSFSYSILLPQALVLASIYFAYIVRPLHSWRLIYSASTILQFKLSGLDRQEELQSYESVLRLFWSCFLIECDRLAELELPRSSLQQLTDETSLPSCDNLSPLQSTCYLAEISIRRLLNRIHNCLYPRKQHIFSLSATTLMTTDEFSTEEIAAMHTVCDELRRQLDVWYASIPEPYRPSLGADPTGNDRQMALRIRYFAARNIIYRPFVLYVTLAINNIKQWAMSSLEAVVSILEDMQRKQRILSKV